jgi:hypothetical protein
MIIRLYSRPDETGTYATLNQLKQSINDMVTEFIEENFKEVKPADIGLDERSATRVFVGDDGIAITDHNRRTMDYYGGFEYVDKEHVTQLGGYIFYSIEDDRVAGHCEELELADD